MILRGIDFGPVFDATGLRNFDGEGYRHHKILRWLGLDLAGSTFVAKTTTLYARAGNLPLEDDGVTLKELSPRCILPNLQFKNLPISIRMFLKGLMGNAVALSGPGAEFVITKIWQHITEKFFMSFMPISKTAPERMLEVGEFVALLRRHLPHFKAPAVGLQINYSCPNVDSEHAKLFGAKFVEEVRASLDIAAILGIPLGPKFNVLAPIKAVKEISEHAACDFICIPNTLLWGSLPEKINWEKLFGTNTSPLAEFGGGGFSGPQFFPLALKWVKQARNEGITKPINVGGGIFKADDVDLVKAAGGSSIFLSASVTNLRPWRTKGINARAHQLFEEGETQ